MIIPHANRSFLMIADLIGTALALKQTLGHRDTMAAKAALNVLKKLDPEAARALGPGAASPGSPDDHP
jgi:hypothetical protein